MMFVEFTTARRHDRMLLGTAAIAALCAAVVPGGALAEQKKGGVCVSIVQPQPNQTFHVGQVMLHLEGTPKCPPYEAAGKNVEVQIERPGRWNTFSAPLTSPSVTVHQAGQGHARNFSTWVKHPGSYRLRARKLDLPGWGGFTDWVAFKVVGDIPGASKLHPKPIPKPGLPPVKKPAAPSQ